MAINLSSLLISSFLSFLLYVHPTLALQQGFTTNMIHRESPLSPLSTPSLNKYNRLTNSIHRSISRIDRFRTSSKSSPSDAQTRVKSAPGEYIMELSFGTPPVSQLGIIDTGSDLIWTQCQPCLQCYKQQLPIFDPRKSSSYKTKSCDSEACQELSASQSSCSRNNVCNYFYQYGDRSHTAGNLATETITFKSERQSKGATFRGISFGCGHDNAGTFRNDGSALVGLGGGPLSLVSQLGSSIGRKFSYCLIPFFKEGNYTSKLSFGNIGQVKGPGVISTPIIKGEPDTFYFLTLEGVSVGKTKIPFSKKSSTSDYSGTTSQGNIIIDSGTTLTLLPSDMYDELFTSLEEAIQGEEADDPTGYFKLCYKTTKDGADLNIPNVTAHFDGGDVVWKPINTFVQVADDIVCLAILPSDPQLGAIIGNIAQMDFLVGYDIEEGKVSFKPTDCTTH